MRKAIKAWMNWPKNQQIECGHFVILTERCDIIVFLLQFRHVSLGLQMDEVDFLLLHKLVVHQLKSKSHMTKGIGMMKMNAIVSKEKHINPDEEEGGPQPQQDNVQDSPSKGKKKKGKRQSKKGKKESDVNPQAAAAAAELPDVVMLPNRDMATQTPESIENDIIEGEEDFQRNNIDEVRKKFIVDEIKPEDFDSDYENENEEDNICSPDVVIRPSDEMDEDESELKKLTHPRRIRKSKEKKLKKNKFIVNMTLRKKKKLFVHEMQSKGQMME